ncbi:MAG: phytanoyl-CoA dioxygenase family protein [Anaerolineae bacterium]|nr:phytanoyl-CoA dioxygenase family protein [Anaerolineae bacterium]
MLTEEQIAHFYREGYVLVRGLVPSTVIDDIMVEAKQRVREGDKWQPTIFDHENPAVDAQVHQLLWTPEVIDAAGDLLGTPPRVYYGMLAIVPAKGGNGLPWHQDNQYTHILGGALNVFIALSEITPDMGTLWIGPRTHRLGVQPSEANTTTAPGHRESTYEPENPIQLPTLQPGDACIFDRSTLHRSLQNTTDRPRFAYAAQFQAAHSRQAESGERDPKRMLASDLAKMVV